MVVAASDGRQLRRAVCCSRVDLLPKGGLQARNALAHVLGGSTVSAPTVGVAMLLAPVMLREDERLELERRSRARSIPSRQRIRARVILLAADGLSNRAISRVVGMRYEHVGTWRRRFMEEGLAGLEERPRPGRPALYGADARHAIIETLAAPAPSPTGWTIKAIAEALSGDLGISTSQVRRICLDLGITPWKHAQPLSRRRRAS